GRGCTHKCSFCYRMDKGFRPRSPESIIKEIKFLQRTYGITYIAFSDELLMSSKKRTIELCTAFIEADLNIKWDCNGRLNNATPEVLKIMKDAGCVFINYGIEALDDNVLKNMHKDLTVKQITKGVEATLNAGISPGLNIIFGNLGDTVETLWKGVDFLLKYDDKSQMRTIRPVCPYPGCELYYKAIELGLLKNVEDFYENKCVNSDLLSVNFTNLTDEEFHTELFKANSILIKNHFKYKSDYTLNEAKKLYLEHNTSFRGFR
ncbi:MAG: radical SAM protein, partial [Proteobacteria bacterium]|nr:radical SAM protein [Pseudomonadota bacterium]